MTTKPRPLPLPVSVKTTVDVTQIPFEPAVERQRSLAHLDQVLATFEDDARPLVEQEWLWAEAKVVLYRVQPMNPVWSTLIGEQESTEAQRWWRCMVKAFASWHAQPLVWRVQDGVAQAVFWGSYRFTWSADQPQGLFENYDLGQGWAEHQGSASWPAACLTTLSTLSKVNPARGSLDHVLEQQVARHAQRGQVRRTVWLQQEQGVGLSTNPTLWAMGTTQEQRDAIAQRFRASLRAFAQALAQLDPFWRTVLRVMVRRCTVSNHGTVQIENDPLPGLLQRWNAWKTVAAEHPRAHLLLGDAIQQHRFPPNVHVWRPELWQAQHSAYGFTRSATWNAVRHHPKAQVATALRMDSGMTALDVLTLCQIKHALPAILRAVPESWWLLAHAAFREHPSVREAMATFAMRRVRAFLAAAATLPWVEQRLSLTQWLLIMQPVMEWAGVLHDVPWEQPDPSWSWNSLVHAWMDQQATLSDWPVPLHPCFHQNVRVSVVSTNQAWTLLGGVMHNCLKDDRSDDLRGLVRAGHAVLVRLSSTTTSAVLLERIALRPDPNDPAEYHRASGYTVGQRHEPPSHVWTIDQFHGAHNASPPDDHARIAQDLLALFNAAVVPGVHVPREEVVHRLAHRPDLRVLVDALNLDDSLHARNPSPLKNELDPADDRWPWSKVKVSLRRSLVLLLGIRIKW